MVLLLPLLIVFTVKRSVARWTREQFPAHACRISVTPSDGAEAILEGPSGELPHFPLSIAPCFLLRPFLLRLFLLFTGFPSLLGCGQSFRGFEQWGRVIVPVCFSSSPQAPPVTKGPRKRKPWFWTCFLGVSDIN
ncbi:hypothetical protein D623_10022802 [Myotis brandtii]|uniref:Secreted protein n=1 Tax=Myotis brandtii TaxID=109478 RepID=S7NGM9_MYOBR|nr:hypothetical protein D623_10022802 [Myotis brandtii]